MSYIALYRKFRPKTFDEVVGQDHIVKTLQNQISQNMLSHAYLFCGTRGTGKTSCAKIFAKAVNCQNAKNGSPCGECESCKKILANGNLDILEIDAASNNRVDEIRDLREKVNYLPSVGKYKVYIIDEVHMLTDSAFNALLKTLEEPPAHIIFILATTEPQKLPATILSRCMRFDFKLVSEADLIKLLERVFAETQTTYEHEALKLIARFGKGSVRDTLSVAEMCKSFSNNNITYKSAKDCLGATDENVLLEICSAVANKKGAEILSKIEELYSQGKNLSVLLDDLSECFKNLMTAKVCGVEQLGLPQNSAEAYKIIAEKLDTKFLLDCTKKLIEAQNGIKYTSNEKVFVQSLLLSLFYDDNLEIALLKNRMSKLEQVLANQDVSELQKKTLSSSDKTQQEIKIEKIAENINNAKDNPFKTNEIQSKQTVDANGKTANQILGEFGAYCRQKGEMMLFASMGDLEGVAFENEVFCFYCKTNSCQESLQKHKTFILEYLQKHHNINLVEIKLVENKTEQTKNKLIDLFGDKIKIV